MAFETVVIGAGIAGLTAARALKRAGQEVLVVEKSRGLGGRAATRRLHAHRIDHGAQYFTVRDERFQAQVDEWLEQKHAAVWSEGFHALTSEGLEAPSDGHPRYIFPHGMNAIGKLLGQGLEIRTQTRVERLLRGEQGWRLELTTGETLNAERVLINVPSPQALDLCRDAELSSETHNALQEVTFAPCWTLMAGYPKRDLSWRGVMVKDEEVARTLTIVAHNSSKRDAEGDETVLVINGSPSFSAEHLEDDEEVVKEKMLSAATVLGDWLATPNWTDMQRWRYSMVTEPYGERYLKEGSLFFCGDWCGGAKVEAAYLSGLELGQRLT